MTKVTTLSAKLRLKSIRYRGISKTADYRRQPEFGRSHGRIIPKNYFGWTVGLNWLARGD
jgi:hypothetical protein